VTAVPAIRFEDVSKSFGRIRALDGVSFEVPVGSVFGLLGPNGAGKTTLFSIAASFLRPDRGRVSVLGIDVRRIAELQGRFTILPQDAQFQRNVPIIEQLVFFRRLEGASPEQAQEDVERTLEAVGLAGYGKRGIHSLSHGMQKRLGIAQAFLGSPEVILLDEPTSGLDPQNARQIRDLVLELRSRATTVISSHNLAEIQELCDHVAILDGGKLVVAGTVEEITRSGKELELELPRALTADEEATLLGIEGVKNIAGRSAGRYMLTLDPGTATDGTDAIIAAVLRRLLESGITPRRVYEGQSLESRFLKLTGAAGPET